jgi:nucleoside-triphosphatase
VSARVLLEGRPGSGKTTAAERVASLLQRAGVTPGGFLTREIREGGRREGFEIQGLSGGREVLAHVRLPGPPRVGRYGVDLAALERVALPSLERLWEVGAVVIDELGKMELASEPLREAVNAVLEGPLPVVATVHAFRHPFTDALKDRPGVETLAVTAGTRDELPELVVERLLH